MGNFVGIDLGTTYSALAALNSIGKPEIVPNAESERITPSAILISEEESVEVGRGAKNQRVTEESRFVEQVKREMGNKDYSFSVDGQAWGAEQLSAEILKKLRDECSQSIGVIDRAVITVPAHFDEARRKATMDAGALAGFRVDALINEPTAAALYYALTAEVGGRILVFDLGGGTFDVTVMDVQGQDIQIISSGGDSHLGGVDFDKALLEIVKEKYREASGQDLDTASLKIRQDLEGIEDLKKGLSNKSKRKIAVGDELIEVRREEFEEAISPYVAKAEMLIESTLDEAKTNISDIKEVLLVGGSSRIPYVQNRLEKLFGFKPVMQVNVDECVALGAALHAGLHAIRADSASVPAGLAGGLKDVKLTDVCNSSFGAITVGVDDETGREGLRNSILLRKNTPLPCEHTETYYTMQDGQEAIQISITQGEDEDPEYVKVIAEKEMRLPPNRPANRPIEVTYRYDHNQRMHCVFRDVESDRALEVSLHKDEGDEMSIGGSRENASGPGSFTIE